MAIGVTIVAKLSLGSVEGRIVDIALDASYAAGGYAFTGSSCGLGTIAYFHGYMKTGENLVVNYNHTDGKFEVLKGAGTTTVTTGSGAFSELATNDTYASSSVIVRALVIGAPANKG